MVCRNKYIDERFHQSGRSNDISQVDRVALLLFGVGSVGDEPTRNDKAHLFGQTHLAFLVTEDQCQVEEEGESRDLQAGKGASGANTDEGRMTR